MSAPANRRSRSLRCVGTPRRGHKWLRRLFLAPRLPSSALEGLRVPDTIHIFVLFGLLLPLGFLVGGLMVVGVAVRWERRSSSAAPGSEPATPPATQPPRASPPTEPG
jgi:hypothetical protein